MPKVEDVTTNYQRRLIDQFEGLSPAHLIESEKNSVVKLALSVLSEKYQVGEKMDNVKQVRNYFQLKLSERKNEVFSALFLTNKHTIIAYEELFQGTIDGASVHIRVVAQKSLELNSAAVIFAHNHPAGDPTPSDSDDRVTQKLKEALGLFDIRVLDHIVVGTAGTISMAELGMV